MIRPTLILACVAALALAGCGKIGTLDQPGPVYGAKAKAKWRADHKAAAEASAKQKEESEPEPLPPDHIQDPYTELGPARAHPIPGAPSGINSPAQPGVLPDPASPQ